MTAGDALAAHVPGVRHDGACGERRRCWRPSCQTRFDPFKTIEILAEKAIAHCHGAEYHLHDAILSIETTP